MDSPFVFVVCPAGALLAQLESDSASVVKNYSLVRRLPKIIFADSVLTFDERVQLNPEVSLGLVVLGIRHIIRQRFECTE